MGSLSLVGPLTDPDSRFICIEGEKKTRLASFASLTPLWDTSDSTATAACFLSWDIPPIPHPPSPAILCRLHAVPLALETFYAAESVLFRTYPQRRRRLERHVAHHISKLWIHFTEHSTTGRNHVSAHTPGFDSVQP